MAEKSETSVGIQLVLAVIILFVAWAVLKWVVKVVVSVAVTVIVIGGILFAVWIFLGRNNRT